MDEDEIDLFDKSSLDSAFVHDEPSDRDADVGLPCGKTFDLSELPQPGHRVMFYSHNNWNGKSRYSNDKVCIHKFRVRIKVSNINRTNYDWVFFNNIYLT